MRGLRRDATLGIVAAILLGAVAQAALPTPVAAQQARPSATLKAVVGRVEILRTGQAQWSPAVPGARLVEGDDLRAFSGASAELVLPDTSLVVLAENSRLHVTRLEFDQQQQSRLVLLHLAVGKLRAAVARAGIALVRARQSNFVISTPTAVAAARGTIVWIFTDAQKSLFAVAPDPDFRILSRIECITLAQTARRRQMVLAGSLTTDCTPPVPTPSDFLSLANPLTAGADLGGAVVLPSTVTLLALVTGTEPAGAGSGLTVDPPPTGLPGPSSLGVDQNRAKPACASPPCN